VKPASRDGRGLWSASDTAEGDDTRRPPNGARLGLLGGPCQRLCGSTLFWPARGCC
jgi:hypothetical protein